MKIWEFIDNSLNINGTNLISRRGELLSIFSDWTSLLKVRPNPSIDVFAFDGAQSDKSLSSERIFTSFFKQRRPFNALYNGIPAIAATKYPDIIHNFLFLNTSGNYCSQRNDTMFNYFFTAGTLTQELTAGAGYQTRYISRDGEPNQTRGGVYGLRIPTTNSNNSRICEASGNEMSQYGLFLDPSGSPKRIDGPINVSTETMNRYKQFTRMFTDIQNEAAAYASNQKSGDNTWFAPASMLSSASDLALTVNACAELKTFFYIMNDAIENAFSSQYIKATKCGTPDSTYVGLTAKNSYLKNEYSTQFQRMWSAMKNFPMNKDVIDKWNQYKLWSKMTEKDLYDHENSLIIPIFMLTRFSPKYYNDQLALDTNNGDHIKGLPDSSKAGMIQHLFFSANTQDHAHFMFPQGDWYSYFIQTQIASLGPDNFMRYGKANNKLVTDNPDILKTANLYLNAGQLEERVINHYEDLAQRDGEMFSPVSGVIYQRDIAGNEAKPDMIFGNGNKGQTNKIPVQNKNVHNSHNLFFDMVVSNHTVTAFMMAYMDKIVSMSMTNDATTWIRAFNIADYYYSRLSKFSKSGDPVTFGDPLPSPTINALPKPLTEMPKYNQQNNLMAFHPIAQIHSTGYLYTPTRFNIVESSTFDANSNTPYRLFGNRYSMIDRSGKADRDITKDNTLATIMQGGSNKNSIWGYPNGPAVHYLANYTIIRPNANMWFNGGKGTTDSRIFPIYIGEHIGSMIFHDHINSTNDYCSTYSCFNGGIEIPLTQLNQRSLIVNTDDDITSFKYLSATCQPLMSQVYSDYSKFCRMTGMFYIAGSWAPGDWIPSSQHRIIDSRSMFEYYLVNGFTNITDDVVNEIFHRWDNNNFEMIPITKFNVL